MLIGNKYSSPDLNCLFPFCSTCFIVLFDGAGVCRVPVYELCILTKILGLVAMRNIFSYNIRTKTKQDPIKNW